MTKDTMYDVKITLEILVRRLLFIDIICMIFCMGGTVSRCPEGPVREEPPAVLLNQLLCRDGASSSTVPTSWKTPSRSDGFVRTKFRCRRVRRPIGAHPRGNARPGVRHPRRRRPGEH